MWCILVVFSIKFLWSVCVVCNLFVLMYNFIYKFLFQKQKRERIAGIVPDVGVCLFVRMYNVSLVRLSTIVVVVIVIISSSFFSFLSRCGSADGEYCTKKRLMLLLVSKPMFVSLAFRTKRPPTQILLLSPQTCFVGAMCAYVESL